MLRLERERRSEASFNPFVRLKDWFWTFSSPLASRRKHVQNACLGAQCVRLVHHSLRWGNALRACRSLLCRTLRALDLEPTFTSRHDQSALSLITPQEYNTMCRGHSFQNLCSSPCNHDNPSKVRNENLC